MRDLTYNLLHGLKGLDAWVRTMRLRLSLRAARLRRRLLIEFPFLSGGVAGDDPWLLVDLRTTHADGQQGRRVYALILYFIRGGYRVAIVAHQGFVGNIDRKLKGLLLEQPIVVIPRLEDFGGSGAVLLTRKAHRTPPKGVRRQVVLKTSGVFRPSATEWAFPFTLHPRCLHRNQDLQLARFRQIPRRWRLFFSGAFRSVAYDTHYIRREFDKVPRPRVLEIVRRSLGGNGTVTAETSKELEELLVQDLKKFVFVSGSTGVIPLDRWLEVLAHAAVFVAAPGVSYPMCHNIIEALAVGTVPLTEYPEQFDPPLVHGENCLVYVGEEQLATRVREIMKSSPEDLAAISEGATRYYDRYLSPQAFLRRFEAEERAKLTLHLKAYERPRVTRRS